MFLDRDSFSKAHSLGVWVNLTWYVQYIFKKTASGG